MKTRLSQLLGIDTPLIQGGMSWASSNAELALAVSEAGALGVIAAGPMYPDALRAAIRKVKSSTRNPYAVNVPLYNKRAAEYLDIVLEEHVPILIASQGGPKAHIARFKEAGVTWIHVTANPAHAKKAEEAGVDAVVAVGMEAGGHPGPDEISSLVLTRATVRNVSIPVIAAGGVADGAGVAAMLALGAEGVQLGTRFLLTHEASLHQAYKAAVLGASLNGTAIIGRGRSPIRMLRNEFAERYEAAARSGASDDELNQLFASSSLKLAALDGNVAEGKVEAGQCAGMIDQLEPAGELVARLMREAREAVHRTQQWLE
ncbi:MAG: nitronate monooxygenase family protein [Pigmentiphaga sp.]|nr:nitronate monooxygenase family protein [Pigmentiphaga sp.]